MFTKQQLVQICKNKGITGYSNKNKSWLTENCFMADSKTDHDRRTVKQLKEICKSNGIKRYSNKRKVWLKSNCGRSRKRSSSSSSRSKQRSSRSKQRSGGGAACQKIMCNADIDDKRQYRRWALTNHPDKGGSTEAFQLVSGCATSKPMPQFCKR